MDLENTFQMCKKCFETKKLLDFKKRKATVNGFGSTCKKCSNLIERNRHVFISLKEIHESIKNKTKLKNKNFLVLEDLGTKIIHNECRRLFLIKCDCGNEIKFQQKNIQSSISCGQKTCPYSAYSKHTANSLIIKSQNNDFYISNSIWNSYIKKAKERNLEFDIHPADILELWIKQNGCCNKTGRKLLVPSDGNKNSNRTWSINRIDSTKGYVKDNIELVHKFCNMIQNKYSDMALDTFCVARTIQILKNKPEYAEYLKELLKQDNNNSEVLDAIWKEASKYKSISKKKGVSKIKLWTEKELEEEG